MYSYTATIGRNVPIYSSVSDSVVRQEPLPDVRWAQFVEDVQALMRRALHGALIETHYGKGTWGGIEEESAKITLLTDNPVNVNVGYLSVSLEGLAREYGQDAIALTIGTSELILSQDR